jgi:hypothetical protein
MKFIIILTLIIFSLFSYTLYKVNNDFEVLSVRHKDLEKQFSLLSSERLKIVMNSTFLKKLNENQFTLSLGGTSFVMKPYSKQFSISIHQEYFHSFNNPLVPKNELNKIIFSLPENDGWQITHLLKNKISTRKLFNSYSFNLTKKFTP